MIGAFKGRYFFLSNFYPGGSETNEHLYQSEKAQWPDDRQWVLESPTPNIAKRRGRRVQLRPDWEDIKNEVMKRLLVMKFEHGDLAKKLRNTGDEELVEGNTWGDHYWGVDARTGKGLNT